MRRSARRTRPAGPKSAPERAISPSTSDLSVTLVTPSVSPTPEVAMRQYATPGQKPDGSMKRPMNAFILFSNEKRSELADLNPHLSNAAVSVLLGQRWREMLSAEKSGYVMAAKRIKEDFHAQHPDAKTRCVSRKAKRAKLDAAGRMGRSITPPSLQALALVGSRLNQTEPQGAVYGHPGEHRCESASTYTQRSAFDAPSRRSFDEEEYDDDDDEDMRWEANFDEPRASAPSSDEPQMRHTAMAVEYQPTLLEQLCTVAENEHTAAAHMLSAFGTAG